LCAAGLSAGWGCSDDPEGAASTRFETLPDQGGSAGASSNQTGSSGTGAAAGGTGGSEGGNAAPGLSGNGAASGEVRTADAGLIPSTGDDEASADAGAAPAEEPAAEPDAEAPPTPPEPEPPVPPAQDDVTFGDVFPLLVTNCGNCHGADDNNRPRFAQAGNQAASFTATQAMSTGQGAGSVVSGRIVARAVTTRNMPPACNGNALGTGACLDVAEGALLQAWVTQGAQQ